LETRRQSTWIAWKGMVVAALVAIAVTVAIFNYTFRYLRDSANQRRCLSNLKALWSASMMYAQDYDGWMPMYTNCAYPGSGEFASPQKLRSSLDKYVREKSAWFCPGAMSARKYYDGECDYRYSTYVFGFRKPGELRADRLVEAAPRVRKPGWDQPRKVGLIADDGHYSLDRFGRAHTPHWAGFNIIFLDGHIETISAK